VTNNESRKKARAEILNKSAPKVIDVARLAGVSTATVSRVLNNPDKVTKSTRDAVLEAVKATGYQVNRAARNLRTNKTKTVLALVPNLANPFFSNILSGLERELNAADYSLLVTDSGDAGLSASGIERWITAGQADGLILLDGSVPLSDMQKVSSDNPNCKLVFACEWVEGFDCPSVRADNEGGIGLLVDHLWDLGHRFFGHVKGPEDNILSKYRASAFEHHVREKGGVVRPEWMLDGDFSIVSGAAAAEQILKMPATPTAWVCASDQIAFGLISTLLRAGVNVPGDVSVTGFDNIEMTEVFNPPLTTIHQHRNKMGQMAAQCMLELLNEREAEGSVENPNLMPVYLVARESTGPVNG
jgi:LacI family repressor for deo operon, udp, cdd, tsx, nupC, and nupG